jgi:hypothetical protein
VRGESGGIEAVFGLDLAKKNVFRSTTLISLEKLFSSENSGVRELLSFFAALGLAFPPWVCPEARFNE